MSKAALLFLGETGAPLPLEEVGRLLAQAKRSGRKLAMLAGDEPLNRRDLPRLLELARRLGLVVGLATEGRDLAEPAVRALLAASQVVYVRAALYDATAEAHDARAGSGGAFEATTRGLAALVADLPPVLHLDVTVPVTAGNVSSLEEIVTMIKGWPRKRPIGIRFVAPTGALPKSEWPAADAVAKHLGGALALGVSAGSDLLLTWEGFPPCILEEHAHLRDETLRCATPRFGPVDAKWPVLLEGSGERSHPYPCQECLHEPTCPGAPELFLEHDGESALRPTKAVRANSFNYERSEDGGLDKLSSKLEPGPDCSAYSLELEGGAVRNAIVEIADAGFVLCRTPTSDFTEEQIHEIKVRLEQLYFDGSTAGAALDDFIESVRRLRLHPACRECPQRANCAAVFRIESEPPFKREERWLAKEVSRLRGRVLDVGCGEQLYRTEIDGLLEEGLIEYHGLDPDAEVLDRMRESGFAGTLHHGEIESFEWRTGYFDYVLLLRSFNHLRDLEVAFDRIAELIRPRGQLVLCDSPPFAMVRTLEQVSYADEFAPKGHEHFRNWTSQQVVEYLARYPFRVDIHRPVSPKTANQWILKLMREE